MLNGPPFNIIILMNTQKNSPSIIFVYLPHADPTQTAKWALQTMQSSFRRKVRIVRDAKTWTLRWCAFLFRKDTWESKCPKFFQNFISAEDVVLTSPMCPSMLFFEFLGLAQSCKVAFSCVILFSHVSFQRISLFGPAHLGRTIWSKSPLDEFSIRGLDFTL